MHVRQVPLERICVNATRKGLMDTVYGRIKPTRLEYKKKTESYTEFLPLCCYYWKKYRYVVKVETLRVFIIYNA